MNHNGRGTRDVGLFTAVGLEVGRGLDNRLHKRKHAAEHTNRPNQEVYHQLSGHDGRRGSHHRYDRKESSIFARPAKATEVDENQAPPWSCGEGHFAEVIGIKMKDKNSFVERFLEFDGELEPLRRRILEMERELVSYGFEPFRGIETYKISELRRIVTRSKREREVKDIITHLIGLQEMLYQKLYRLAGMRRLVVDTDSPEKQLKRIHDWLEGKNKKMIRKESKLKRAAMAAIDASDGEITEVIKAIRRVYKRDYDCYRVLTFLLGLRGEKLGSKRSNSLTELAGDVLNWVKKEGKAELKKKVEKVLGR